MYRVRKSIENTFEINLYLNRSPGGIEEETWNYCNEKTIQADARSAFRVWTKNKAKENILNFCLVIIRGRSLRVYPSHLTTRTVGAIIAMMKCAKIVSRDKKSETTAIEHQLLSSLQKRKKNEFYFVKSPNDNNGLIYVSVSKKHHTNTITNKVTISIKNIFIRTDRNCQPVQKNSNLPHRVSAITYYFLLYKKQSVKLDNTIRISDNCQLSEWFVWDFFDIFPCHYDVCVLESYRPEHINFAFWRVLAQSNNEKRKG